MFRHRVHGVGPTHVNPFASFRPRRIAVLIALSGCERGRGRRLRSLAKPADLGRGQASAITTSNGPPRARDGHYLVFVRGGPGQGDPRLRRRPQAGQSARSRSSPATRAITASRGCSRSSRRSSPQLEDQPRSASPRGPRPPQFTPDPKLGYPRATAATSWQPAGRWPSTCPVRPQRRRPRSRPRPVTARTEIEPSRQDTIRHDPTDPPQTRRPRRPRPRAATGAATPRSTTTVPRPVPPRRREPALPGGGRGRSPAAKTSRPRPRAAGPARSCPPGRAIRPGRTRWTSPPA